MLAKAVDGVVLAHGRELHLEEVCLSSQPHLYLHLPRAFIAGFKFTDTTREKKIKTSPDERNTRTRTNSAFISKTSLQLRIDQHEILHIIRFASPLYYSFVESCLLNISSSVVNPSIYACCSPSLSN